MQGALAWQIFSQNLPLASLLCLGIAIQGARVCAPETYTKLRRRPPTTSVTRTQAHIHTRTCCRTCSLPTLSTPTRINERLTKAHWMGAPMKTAAANRWRALMAQGGCLSSRGGSFERRMRARRGRSSRVAMRAAPPETPDSSEGCSSRCAVRRL